MVRTSCLTRYCPRNWSTSQPMPASTAPGRWSRPPHRRATEDPEGGKEQADVEHGRRRQAHGPRQLRVAGDRSERGESLAEDEEDPQQPEEHHAADEPGYERRAVLVGHAPGFVDGELHGLRHAERSPQQSQEPDDEADAAAVEPPVRELDADDREVMQGRIADVHVGVRPGTGDQCQQGQAHQQQREQRQKAVERDQPGEHPAAVVAELLDDGEDDRHRLGPLLPSIERANDGLDRVSHGTALPTAGARHPTPLARGESTRGRRGPSRPRSRRRPTSPNLGARVRPSRARMHSGRRTCPPRRRRSRLRPAP